MGEKIQGEQVQFERTIDRLTILFERAFVIELLIPVHGIKHLHYFNADVPSTQHDFNGLLER